MSYLDDILHRIFLQGFYICRGVDFVEEFLAFRFNIESVSFWEVFIIREALRLALIFS
jgi:hypothetical protein